MNKFKKRAGSALVSAVSLFSGYSVNAGGIISCIESCSYDFDELTARRNDADESIQRHQNEVLRLKELKGKIRSEIGESGFNAPEELINQYNDLASAHHLELLEMALDGRVTEHEGISYWFQVIRNVPKVINELREYGNGLGIDGNIFEFDTNITDQFCDEMIQKLKQCEDAHEDMMHNAVRISGTITTIPRVADAELYTDLYTEPRFAFGQYLEKLMSVLKKLEDKINNKDEDLGRTNFLKTSFLILFDYTPPFYDREFNVFDKRKLDFEKANYVRREKFQEELNELREKRENGELDKFEAGVKIKKLKMKYNTYEINKLEQEIRDLSKSNSNAVRIRDLRQRIEELESPSED